MSIVPIALRIYPSNSHSIVTLFLTVMLCVITSIVTNSLIQLRFQILRMFVEKGLVVSYFVALSNLMKADPA